MLYHLICFSQFINDDEIIDEYGNAWDPFQHPIMDQEQLEYESYGVTIDSKGAARVERLDLYEQIVTNESQALYTLLFAVNMKFVSRSLKKNKQTIRLLLH